MIIRFVKMTFRTEKTGAFEKIFAETRPFILQFEGCHQVELFADTRNSDIYFTISHWDNEAHLDAYRTSDFFKATWSQVKPMFSEKAEAWSLTEPGKK